jgi:DNA mismatch repair protein MutS
VSPPKTPGAAPQDTPVIKQYREIKSSHPNSVLFFRMGDFYEMFFEDAEIASRELGITLTSRNNGGAANVPLAGIPVKAATEYVKKLVDRGHRVAICEQVEDPKTAKGIVRRAVVETVTPGAVLSERLLETPSNNFLVALLDVKEAIGLAALDLSTGEFVLETLGPSDLESALVRYSPREVVIAEGYGRPAALAEHVMITRRDPWEFDVAQATEDLTRRFDISNLTGLGIETDETAALAAGGALLRYALELQPSGLPHLNRPTLKRSDGIMPLDRMTRRNLELVDQIHRESTAPTVLSLLDQTKTAMGSRLLRMWLLAPLTNRPAIEARHDAVEVLLQDARGRNRLREALDGVRDIERLAGRVAARRASPRDLGALRDSLQRLPDLQGALQALDGRVSSERLETWAESLDLAADLCTILTDALVERPPQSVGEHDTVRPGASNEVDETRALRDGGKQFITELQQREREATGIPTLKVGYNRVFGYYIEVTKPHRDSVPASYERRQTLTNAERYVTPELKEYESRVLNAEDRILDLEREIVEQLCQATHSRLTRLQSTAGIVAHLDVVAAFGDVASSARYIRPTMTDGTELELKACRHPVVERMIPHGKFIPNDIHLDMASRVMLLTGPNMAGKSTILRQVGLTVLLAQIGSYVPADSARIGVVDRVFTRVGASDNLSGGQSTFMVEMSEASAILHNATERSLVLLDEIGRGTSTYDGVAIAWSMTEYLHDTVGTKTIFATHYHELTQLTEELQSAVNFNVAVRESGDEIVFQHHLVPGGADRSYGIHVARLAGLVPDVVKRARVILKLLEAGHQVAGIPLPAEPDPDQLGLFEPEHPVIDELRTLKPDEMTPLEALATLAEMQRRVAEEE